MPVFSHRLLVFISVLLSNFVIAQKVRFPIVTNNSRVTILYDGKGPSFDSISASLLALDIERVTGYKPGLVTAPAKAKGNIIVIGSITSSLIQQFVKQLTPINNLQGKWECYGFKVIDQPLPGISKALVIAGSDARGTAYGVFTLSEKLGVNPWYWWADVAVKRQKELYVDLHENISEEPSVKYRGIFINDEDWGLRPWAANTFEPEKKNIGPKTYAKVFELLLRLKANLIWPAMHPGTHPFYNDPANRKTAMAFSIIVGSSHAEPMLRNNVGEWDEKTMGHFNYHTNKENVYQYWKKRVEVSKDHDVMYTLGMRGVHDSGMEGVKDAREAVPLLERIISDQRGLLEELRDTLANVKQVFTAYKEVLDIYDNGLKLPDDVTLVWPDDNYGYIHRLNNQKENIRAGGSGVYYHASYWGRPHDYLWLGTTHPSLIREEMMKAFGTGANRLWVLNVGDIKAIEYNMQMFLDMAYDANSFKRSDYSKKHLQQWCENIFGQKEAQLITETLWQYYTLTFERRPEFMGWSQTEPTTKTKYSGYNHFYFGDEAQRRIDKYNALQTTVRDMRRRIHRNQADAFYQLVYYPVMCSAWMNNKFLYRDKAYLYAKQNRISAYDYARLSKAAYDSIMTETAYFNNELQNGKWKDMMSMKPRELPVFDSPVLPLIIFEKTGTWNVLPEGYDTILYSRQAQRILPRFTKGLQEKYFIDVFLSDSVRVHWNATSSAEWIRVSVSKGVLEPVQNKNSHRIWVSIDWSKVPKAENFKGVLTFTVGGKKFDISIEAFQPARNELSTFKGFVESNRMVSVHAKHFSDKISRQASEWILKDGLGRADGALSATVSNLFKIPDTTNLQNNAGYAAYDFLSFSETPLTVTVYTLPTHPLNPTFGMRYGISIDDGTVKIVDFKTVGRSEEWKQNVLSNSAARTVSFPALTSGRHTLKIFAIDPAVALDRILITFGNQQKAYGVIPETVLQ